MVTSNLLSPCGPETCGHPLGLKDHFWHLFPHRRGLFASPPQLVCLESCTVCRTGRKFLSEHPSKLLFNNCRFNVLRSESIPKIVCLLSLLLSRALYQRRGHRAIRARVGSEWAPRTTTKTLRLKEALRKILKLAKIGNLPS